MGLAEARGKGGSPFFSCLEGNFFTSRRLVCRGVETRARADAESQARQPLSTKKSPLPPPSFPSGADDSDWRSLKEGKEEILLYKLRKVLNLISSLLKLWREGRPNFTGAIRPAEKESY